MTRILTYLIYSTDEWGIDKTQDFKIIRWEKQFTGEIKMIGNLTTLRGNFTSYLNIIQWLVKSRVHERRITCIINETFWILENAVESWK